MTTEAGIIYLPNRWSGDTHSDKDTGCVDVDATGQLIAKQAAELKRLQDYDTRLSAVMPSDYKDWHEGSKKEWSELAAESIKMWRDRANEAYAKIERANALLRQAYAVIEEAVELIGSDECTAKETLAAIKQHLGEV